MLVAARHRLLRVTDLSVSFSREGGEAQAVLNGLNFSIDAAEVVGLLGESGCGKSTTALAILGLLPPAARVGRGCIEFGQADLRRLGERELQAIRGAQISMIPQEPGIALSPVMRVGEQIAEVIRAHRPCHRRLRRAVAEEVLAEVGFRHVERIYDAFPHQLSGGQLQRVTIAQALVCRPQLVIADEPTSSLDAASREEILALLRKLRRDRGIAILLISHQPAVLAALADRVLVMYGGRIVEEGRARDVLENPKHPYPQALLACPWSIHEHATMA